MKKKLVSLSLVLMFILTLIPQKSFASSDVKLWINGNYVQSDVAPTIKDSRTLVPVRIISETLGYKVEWNNTDRTVAINNETNSISLKIDDKNTIINGNNKEIDVPPAIINNRTFVPIRFIAENMGVKVDWDNENRTAIVGDGYVKPVATQKTGLDANKVIVVDGGNLSGSRQANVKVDIGFGTREYWAYTNEYGQLVKVTAKQIILQDEANEAVTDKGRYYNDEAKVPGVESKDLDEGHVIADSLGGVSNAYNITPQNATLNRHGNQAYMEKVIRDALRAGGSCTDFVATITYPDTKTQIPSHYNFKYNLNGTAVEDDFDNVNPDPNSTKKVNNPTPAPAPVKEEKTYTGTANGDGWKDPKSPAYLHADGKLIGNKKSMIYHAPGQQGYKKVSYKNAVYFNTASEAQAAGYRAAQK